MLDYGACIFCGRCAAACAISALTISGDVALGTLRRQDLVLRVLVPHSKNRDGQADA
jgi:formate hydrogenlyase subunit 6/NADH:ubiquinone oxidoreductase subunit I